MTERSALRPTSVVMMCIVLAGASACGDESGAAAVRADNNGVDDNNTGQDNNQLDEGAKLRPIADAGDDLEATVGERLTLDGSASVDEDGMIVAWLWNLEDGTARSGETTEVSFDASGTYKVTLVVTDNDGLTDSDEIVVRVGRDNAPPNAAVVGERVAIEGEPYTIAAGGSTDDLGIASWLWDFGDGSDVVEGDADDEGRATHVYNAFGDYTVRLTVVDADGAEDTAEWEMQVLARPDAVMEGPQTALVGEEIELTARASEDRDGQIVRYFWDFADNNFGNGETVTHTFDTPGGYEVSVLVTDNDGLESSAGFKVTVTPLPNEPPVADCGPLLRTTTPGADFVLDAGGSRDPDGTIVSWLWELGDGSEPRRGETAVHRYAELGTYTFTLTVEDDAGASDSAECEVEVGLAPNEAPRAMCSVEPQPAYVGEEVDFDGRASSDADGTLVSWTWDPGDGGEVVEGEQASWTYTEVGFYDARLSVVDDRGDSDEAICRVEVGLRPNIAPRAVCDAMPSAAIVGNEVRFDASSSTDSDGAIVSFAWDFDDGEVGQGAILGHTFDAVGSYAVSLVVVDDRGGSDEATCVVSVALPPNVLPEASCSVSPIEANVGQSVTLDGSASSDSDGSVELWRWDFMDGTPDGFGTITTHTWAAPGDYPVLLTVTDDRGGEDTSECAVKIVDNNAAPVADCSLTPDTVDVGFPFVLDGSMSSDDGDIVSFRWDPGDGSNAVFGQRVGHIYTNPGDFTVELTVTDDRGVMASATCSVTAVANTPPVAIASTQNTTYHVGDAIIFNGRDSYDPDSPDDAIVLYEWDFDDGQSESGMSLRQASHTYSTPGVYLVSLTVTDGRGATDTTEVTVEVLEAMTPDIEGTYSLAPPLQYMCTAFGIITVINFNASQVVFSIAGNELRVSGLPVVMTQSPPPSGSTFSVTGVIAGGCTETYTLSGPVDPSTGDWTFNLSLTGSDCGLTDCVNQTFITSATRQ